MGDYVLLDANHSLLITATPLTLLLPYAGNARTHPKSQIEQIKASIAEFGFTNPILADAKGTVIAGHGRLIAARELGLATVPVITLHTLSPTQIKALRLADNKLALNSGWDTNLLRVELTALQAEDVTVDLGLTGFSSGEMDILLKTSDDPDDEIIPPVPASPRTKVGDIWMLGAHRVGCGDGRDPSFLRQVIGSDRQVDCAFLDPPFNCKIVGHANVKRRHREFAMASGEMGDAEFEAFLEASLGACVAVTRDGGVHFVCMDWRQYGILLAVGQRIYGKQLNVCIWNKSNAGMGSLYRSKFEMVVPFRVGEATHFNAVELGKHGRNRTNVWDYPSVNTFKSQKSRDTDLHPTVKPIAMVADAIQDVTRRGDLVLDIFLGSGTTLLAAERTGRMFRGLDIDPGYVDLALERWTAMTGQIPERVQDLPA